jgi:hypothetical protein
MGGTSRSKQPLKWVEKELDTLAGKLCKLLAGNRCERCGSSGPLDWHHIVTRRIKRLRWDMRNSLCLCKGCHFWWHNVAQLGAQWVWLEHKYGPHRKSYLDMQLATLSRAPKVDREAVKLYLKGELTRLGWGED